MTAAQIHIANGAHVQTLAAVETADGVTLLSTFGASDGAGDTGMHIPAAARAWLAGVAGRLRDA
jgi:phosphoserine phosphatase